MRDAQGCGIDSILTTLVVLINHRYRAPWRYLTIESTASRHPEKSLDGTFSIRALFQHLAQMTSGAIFTQYFALTVYKCDAVADTFKNGIQFLCSHLSGAV